MRFVIKVLGTSISRQIIPGKIFVIGRDENADIPLTDGSFVISKRHCELEQRGDSLLLRGIGVAGCSVNGVKMGPQTSVRLGDQIQIANKIMVVAQEQADRSLGAPVASAPPASRTPMPKIGLYTLVEEIGEVMGNRLYKARTKPDGDTVAVRVLGDEQAKDPALCERFTREVLALKALDHPNVVRLLNAVREGGHTYYVTEFVAAATLADRVRRGPIGARAAAVIGGQIASALALMHEIGAVHRDVSPSSILVTSSGVAKLFNFAFVKGVGEHALPITALGDVVGDVPYHSPEQVKDPRAVDYRTDLYGLGATLFHAISGKPPFQARNYLELIRMILGQPAPSLFDAAPGCPPALAFIVSKLLSKDPAERYEHALDVRAALDEALLETCTPTDETSQQAREEEKKAKAEAGSVTQGGALAGGYTGLELLDIIQFIAHLRKNGVLVVESPTIAGEIRFDMGDVVGARAGDLASEKAVMAILATTEGVFRFRAVSLNDKLPADGPRLKVAPMALEALRRHDASSAGFPESAAR